MEHFSNLTSVGAPEHRLLKSDLQVGGVSDRNDDVLEGQHLVDLTSQLIAVVERNGVDIGVDTHDLEVEDRVPLES